MPFPEIPLYDLYWILSLFSPLRCYLISLYINVKFLQLPTKKFQRNFTHLWLPSFPSLPSSSYLSGFIVFSPFPTYSDSASSASWLFLKIVKHLSPSGSLHCHWMLFLKQPELLLIVLSKMWSNITFLMKTLPAIFVSFNQCTCYRKTSYVIPMISAPDILVLYNLFFQVWECPVNQLNTEKRLGHHASIIVFQGSIMPSDSVLKHSCGWLWSS